MKAAHFFSSYFLSCLLYLCMRFALENENYIELYRVFFFLLEEVTQETHHRETNALEPHLVFSYVFMLCIFTFFNISSGNVLVFFLSLWLDWVRDFHFGEEHKVWVWEDSLTSDSVCLITLQIRAVQWKMSCLKCLKYIMCVVNFIFFVRIHFSTVTLLLI